MEQELPDSAKQTILFFEEFIRKQAVADFIKEYREYLNLPKDGLEMANEDENVFEQGLTFLFVPKRAIKLFPKETQEKPIRIINTCNAFVQQQGIDSFQIKAMLNLYLFFNKALDYPLRTLERSNDLLIMEHIPSELSWYDDEDHYLLKQMYIHFESIGKTHPVALYINPEVSQNQVIDFVKKNWDYVKLYEPKELRKKPAIRKKSKLKQARKDCIYENRDLPRKEIMRMVNKKFPELEPIEYANVGKIISLEKKRRETN